MHKHMLIHAQAHVHVPTAFTWCPHLIRLDDNDAVVFGPLALAQPQRLALAVLLKEWPHGLAIGNVPNGRFRAHPCACLEVDEAQPLARTGKDARRLYGDEF